ncbi:pimeloyl-ACP methyl ester carboxylesterase [Peteryoungia aggregata LMG 23059]|uniref:Pimeloyl-ACP methyl ester carboxylesterase n=1 Tax=Peteryoungia aggregata LMG 23059 TaxID=1368425 RepID=A0ABU0G662_9HYPH|nr:alpha/beta fold hydrolase [Peteryoungia aggregata]MDQ0420827.1 pimeloyl-ACP methyl ester carboxylesterase [Peteryoungia aggregata LMG 23059]
MAVTMDGVMGHLHHASGSTGIVFCSPWGFDALCTVKFHRLIADDLARRGFPSIRFDYPGEGDSLPVQEESTFATWVNAAVRAAAELRSRTGCTQILYYGMGIGAAVALQAGRQDERLAGYMLAASALSGRRYLREVALREKAIEDGIGIDFGYPQGSTVLASFIMDPRLAADLKAVTVAVDAVSPNLPVLVLARPENTADRDLTEALGAAGASVTCTDFIGYGAMLDGVVTSPMPMALIETIGDWFSRTIPAEAVSSPSDAVEAEPAMLSAASFRERAEIVDSRLFGVLCQPASGTESAVIILLNMAYAPHNGWGNIWVDTARTLAHQGVATFRVDLSNIGESPADPREPDQVVYSETQLNDVQAVIRHVRSMSKAPILLAGICSGAHSALYAGAANSDVAGIVSINQLRLVLDPDEDVESLLMAGARPLSDYKRRAFSLGTYKRVLSGDVDVPKAARNIASHAKDRLSRGVSPYLGGLTKLGRLRGQLFGILRRLEERKVPVTFISCRTDGSLAQQQLYFGKSLSGQRAFPGLKHILLENADHTLSPPAIRRQLIEILAEAAEESSRRG